MNDKKKLLFTVTDGIADEYLAEAATTRLIFPTRMVKRVVAVAAMIAILLTCLLWHPATQTPSPALAIRVFAAENGEQTVTVGSDPIPIDSIFNTDACEHSFPDAWDLDDSFFFRIRKPENFPQDCFSRVDVDYGRGNIGLGQFVKIPSRVVESITENGITYESVIIIGDITSLQSSDSETHAQTSSMMNILITHGDETVAVFPVEKRLCPEDSHLCIHGKLKETTDMKIKLYVTQDGVNKLFQTITVRINVSAIGYTLEVTDITINYQ